MRGRKNLIRLGDLILLCFCLGIFLTLIIPPLVIYQNHNSLSERRVKLVDRAEQLQEEYFEEILIPPDCNFYEFGNVVQSLFRELWQGNWLKLFSEIKNIVNPDDRSLKGIYIGSAGDVSTFFLLTNAESGFFIDKYPLALEKLQSERGIEALMSKENVTSYIEEKKVGSSGKKGGLYTTDYYLSQIGGIYGPLVWELLGIGAEDIRFSQHKNYKNIYMVEFNWKHPDEDVLKQRKIIFFSSTDLNDSGSYLPFFPSDLDFCLEKALYSEYMSIEAPFRKGIVEHLKPNGMIVTDRDYKWMIPFIDTTPLKIVEESLRLSEDYEEAQFFGHGTVKILEYDPMDLHPLEENWDFLIEDIMGSSPIDLPAMIKAKIMLEKMEPEERRGAIIQLVDRFKNYTHHRQSDSFAHLCTFIGFIGNLIPLDLIPAVKTGMQKQKPYHYDNYGENDDEPFVGARAVTLDVLESIYPGVYPLDDYDEEGKLHLEEYSIPRAEVLQWYVPQYRQRLQEILEGGRCTEKEHEMILKILDWHGF